MKMIIGKYEATIYPEGDGWTGAISLGFDAAGTRRRVKRKGRTKAQVRDKLREVVEDLEAGVTAAEGYTVADAISDFLDQGMKGKSPETISNYRSLADHHLILYLGAARLKKLTADELDTWMDGRAEALSGRTLRLIQQILERAIRHAQARDKVRRNVASLIIVPDGQEGRPSKAMTLDQAVRLLDHVGPGSPHRLAAYVVVSLLPGSVPRKPALSPGPRSTSTQAQWPSTGPCGPRATPRPGRAAAFSSCPERQPRRSGSTASGKPRNGSRRAGNGRTTTWSSAARTVPRWTGGRSAASSPSSPWPQAWGSSGRPGSYGTRSCPSSAPTA
jgi:hypothetical protein